MDSENRSPIDASSMNSSDPFPADSLNGDPRSVDPVESMNAEIEGFLAANQDLVEEVASLRDALSEKEQTTGILQQELLDNLRSVEAFSADIASLQVENREHASMAACLVQEVQASRVEKIDLLSENAKIAVENQSLDAAHANVKQKLCLLTSDLEEKQAAMAAAQAQVPITCFEIETLQLKKEEFSKEISMLHASNGAMNSFVVQLTEEEKTLLGELDAIVLAKDSAEQKVSDLQATISTLGVQLSSLMENEKLTLNQLHESKARLRQLEDTDNAMASRETDLLAHIQDLESQLHPLRADLDTTGQAPDQEAEKVDNVRTLDVSCMKVAGEQSTLGTLQLSHEMQEGEMDARCQHVQDLENRVADLRAETQTLVRSNEDLEAMLVQQKTEIMVSTQLREDIKKLEGFLNEAEERAQSLQGKEVELKYKLEELTISTNKKLRLSGLTKPLVISGGTIVVVGLLVWLLHAKAKSK